MQNQDVTALFSPVVGYLAYRQGSSGLLLRHGISRPVPMVRMAYFAKNLDRAIEVVKLLDWGGRPLLEEKALSDPSLYAQWDDMSNVGFLFDAGPPTNAAVPVAVQTSVENCMGAMPFLQQLGTLIGHLPAVEILCDAAIPLEVLSEFVSDYGNGSAGIPCATTPAILVKRFELSPDTDIEDLILFLDHGRANLIRHIEYSSSVLVASIPPVQKSLESEGFLFHYRVVIPPNCLADISSANSLLDTLLEWAADSPSRQFDLVFQRPEVDVENGETEKWYNCLEWLLCSLVRISPEPMQFSYTKALFDSVIQGGLQWVRPLYLRLNKGMLIPFDIEFPSLRLNTGIDMVERLIQLRTSDEFETKIESILPLNPSIHQSIVKFGLHSEQCSVNRDWEISVAEAVLIEVMAALYRTCIASLPHARQIELSVDNVNNVLAYREMHQTISSEVAK